MNNRVYNFGAGPAMLPESVLVEAQSELLNWHQLGMSVLEVGHRTPEFMDLLTHAEQSLRELLGIPNNYHILFLGGPARTQFASIPMNFLLPEEQAEYLVTGVWSHMAFMEAQNLKKATCISSEVNGSYLSVPEADTLRFNPDSVYVYYAPNETVNGLRFPYIPQTKGIPLIADMTSCILSEPIDVSQFALIFAGAQKNIANAGLTLVIIRDDLLQKIPEPAIPTMMNYRIQTEHASLYATPPVFNIYLAAKMFEWVKTQGGVEALYQKNRQKAQALYQFIDASEFYTSQVEEQARSLMNVCFSIKNTDLESQFLIEARQQGLAALKGHKLVGGLRASLYNAMPMSGVQALISFMSDFERSHQND